MKRCPTCGIENEDVFTRCYGCGAELPPDLETYEHRMFVYDSIVPEGDLFPFENAVDIKPDAMEDEKTAASGTATAVKETAPAKKNKKSKEEKYRDYKAKKEAQAVYDPTAEEVKPVYTSAKQFTGKPVQRQAVKKMQVTPAFPKNKKKKSGWLSFVIVIGVVFGMLSSIGDFSFSGSGKGSDNVEEAAHSFFEAINDRDADDLEEVCYESLGYDDDYLEQLIDYYDLYEAEFEDLSLEEVQYFNTYDAGSYIDELEDKDINVSGIDQVCIIKYSVRLNYTYHDDKESETQTGQMILIQKKDNWYISDYY